MTLRCALFWDFMQCMIILPEHEVGTVHINARKISFGRPKGQTSWERRSRWKKLLKWILDEMDERICVFFQWLKKEMSDGLL